MSVKRVFVLVFENNYNKSSVEHKESTHHTNYPPQTGPCASESHPLHRWGR